MVSTQGISISVAWAISQYRAALATVGRGGRAVLTRIKGPSEPPEITAYLRSIGIGRNIDAYA
jgi:hypothetical protein